MVTADGIHSPRYGVIEPVRVVTAVIPFATTIEITSLLWSPAADRRF